MFYESPGGRRFSGIENRPCDEDDNEDEDGVILAQNCAEDMNVNIQGFNVTLNKVLFCVFACGLIWNISML